MLKLKALLSKILSWAGLQYDWSYFNVTNTTDTWVPVTSADKVYHRVIPRDIMTVRQVTTTVNKTGGVSANIVAPTVSGFTFVCWLQPATSGWVGAPYVENPMNSTSRVWQFNNTMFTSGAGNVVVTALYKANF